MAREPHRRVDAVVLLPGTGDTVETAPLFSGLRDTLQAEDMDVISVRGVGVRSDSTGDIWR